MKLTLVAPLRGRWFWFNLLLVGFLGLITALSILGGVDWAALAVAFMLGVETIVLALGLTIDEPVEVGA